MGEYTGLRCKVIIKPEYREEFAFLDSKEIQYEWLKSNLNFLRKYGEYPRSTAIPCGSLSYMPKEWVDESGKDTDGFDRDFDKKTGLWTFQCSLTNYKQTIQYFFEQVLCKVAEEVIHLEYYFNDSIRSVFYELVDEKIVESGKEGIKYGYEFNEFNGYEGLGYP